MKGPSFFTLRGRLLIAAAMVVAVGARMPAEEPRAAEPAELLKTAVDRQAPLEQRKAAFGALAGQKHLDAKALNTLAPLVIDPKEDDAVRQHADLVINLHAARGGLCAPLVLVEALRSPDRDTRFRAAQAMSSFRAFPASQLAEIKATLDALDDETYLFLAHVFADVPRLLKIFDGQQPELHSYALSRLWLVTGDVELCLRQYVKSHQAPLPDRVETELRKLDEEERAIKKEIAALVADTPAWHERQAQLEELKSRPARQLQARCNLSKLGMAMRVREIGLEQPVESGRALVKLMADHAAHREPALRILKAIALRDEADRQRLAAAGVAEQLAKLKKTLRADDPLHTMFDDCHTALTTAHENRKDEAADKTSAAKSPRSPFDPHDWRSLLLPYIEDGEKQKLYKLPLYDTPGEAGDKSNPPNASPRKR